MSTTETFNSSGTWTVPIGVTTVQVECEGAGGGGGWSTSSFAGAGGGGGAYAKSTLAVTPGDSYAITVGQKGNGAVPPSPTAGTGGSSTFGATLVVAAGGTGGSAGNTPGTGGTTGASTGTTKTAGSAGSNPSGTTGGAGGSGAAPLGGAGGTAGTAGTAPGGGGGGGYNATAGGSGADGRVVLTYTMTPGAGSATGTTSWTGSADGTNPVAGSTTGVVVFTAVAPGHSLNGGSATGLFSQAGSGLSMDNNGRINATFIFIGTATGSVVPVGMAGGPFAFASTPHGHTNFLFTPPTIPEYGEDSFFGRFAMSVGQSIVKVNGVYTLTPYPWLGDIAHLVEGIDWFQGGRTYNITATIADELEAAGFDV